MALTPEQIALRRSGIGASEVAAVVGEDPWTTPLDVCLRKWGSAEQEKPSLAARLGNLIEEPICALYAEETGSALVPCGTLRHPDYPWALATPDRAAFVGRPPWQGIDQREQLGGALGLVQAKHASMRDRKLFGALGTDEVPTRFILQCTWEMGVTGMRRDDLPVLFDKADFGIWRVDWNEDLWRSLLELVGRFWRDHVVTGKPPPIDASDSYKDWLYRRHPTFERDAKKKGVLTAVVDGCDVDALVKRWALAGSFRDAIDLARKQMGNELRALIGNAYGLQGGWGKVCWQRKHGEAKPDWFMVASELRLLLGQLANAIETPGADVAGVLAAIQAQLPTIEANASKPRHDYSALRGYWKAEEKERLGAQARDFLGALGLPVGPPQEEEKDESEDAQATT